MREISQQEALEKLRAKVSYDCKIKDLAAQFGVSAAFMSSVLAGKKVMTKPMLEEIGVRRSVVYFEVH